MDTVTSPPDDEKTRELRSAHDVLAPVYVERLAHVIDQMPLERAVLGAFRDLIVDADVGVEVGDVGCGTGRLAPFLTSLGLSPRGVDLSPEMVRCARRDYPETTFEEGDVRALPWSTGALAGVLGWYSLMYLTPDDRPGAFGELARVVRPGGYVATAFKVGDDSLRRASGARAYGVDFDIYWWSPQEMARQMTDAGFEVVFEAGRPQGPDDLQPQGYLIARRT